MDNINCLGALASLRENTSFFSDQTGCPFAGGRARMKIHS
jgi:hypothetical protein